MKKVEKYISKNWLCITTGLILTEVFVKMAYAERGYLAYGGEWLTLPIMVLAKIIIRDFVKEIRQWL